MKYFIILVLLLFNTGIYAQIARKTDLQTGKMGFVDASGKTVVPLEYDFLPFQYAPTGKGKRWRLLTTTP
jgi:hypothetical protein